MSDYEVYAIRYASQEGRPPRDNFIEADPHDQPMALDFFVWALVGAERTIIVDTGFDERAGRARGRTVERPVNEGLKEIGVDAGSVEDVIITHLHWDHAGNHDLFPGARYHLQEREMHFCTGRCMCHPLLRKAYNVDDVTQMVRRVFEGRAAFHGENSELADGVTLHWVGGHTKGLQVVRVRTRRGYVVLASDAAHYYANVFSRRPFPILTDVDDMLDGFDQLERMADGASHIIPGHDRQVLALFPPARDGLQGSVRLDAEPLGMPA